MQKYLTLNKVLEQISIILTWKKWIGIQVLFFFIFSCYNLTVLAQEAFIDANANTLNCDLVSITPTTNGNGYCCYNLELSNQTPDFFNKIRLRPLVPNAFDFSNIYSLSNTNQWFFLASGTDLIEVISGTGNLNPECNFRSFPTGTLDFISFCLNNYSNKPQEVLIEWLDCDDVICSEVLTFECDRCVSITNEVLTSLGSGQYQYTFDIRNVFDQDLCNLGVTVTNNNGVTVSPNPLDFSPCLAPEAIATEQTIYFNNVADDDALKIVFESSLFTLNREMDESPNTCFSDTICIGPAVCCGTCEAIEYELHQTTIGLDTCCFSLDFNHSSEDLFTGLQVRTTNGIFLGHIGTGGGWMAEPVKPDLVRYFPLPPPKHSVFLPTDWQNGKINFCLDGYNAPDQSPQDIIIDWLSGSDNNILCTDTLETFCEPPLPESCMEVKDSIHCLADGTYKLDLSIKNKSGFTARKVDVLKFHSKPSGASSTPSFPLSQSIDLVPGDSLDISDIILSNVEPGDSICYQVMVIGDTIQGGFIKEACQTDTICTLVPCCHSLDTIIGHPNCEDGCDGSIDLMVYNGIPPYTYSWSNGATTEDLNDVCQGTYEVTVSDAQGCMAVQSFELEAVITGCCAEDISSLNISTGFDPSSGTFITPVGLDPMWKLIQVPTVPFSGGWTVNVDGPANVIGTYRGWSNTDMQAVYINAFATNLSVANNWVSSTEPYIFEREFCICTNSDAPIPVNFDLELNADNWAEVAIIDENLIETQLYCSADCGGPRYINANFQGVPGDLYNNTLNLTGGNYKLQIKHRNKQVAMGVQLAGTITSNYGVIRDDLCVPRGQIAGYVYNDANANNNIDNSDVRLAGWDVELLDESNILLSTITSDVNGFYFFSNLEPGVYTVREVMKPSYSNISPTINSQTVSVGVNEAIRADFLNYKDCSSHVFDVEINSYEVNDSLICNGTMELTLNNASGNPPYNYNVVSVQQNASITWGELTVGETVLIENLCDVDYEIIIRDSECSQVFTHSIDTTSTNPTHCSALYFDNNDYVEVNTQIAGDLQDNDFTFEAWIKGDEASQLAHPIIFSNRTSHNDGFIFGFHNQWGGSANKMLYVRLNTSNYPLVGYPLALDNTCHHVAIVREGIELKYYMDGQLIGSRTIPANITMTTSNPLWIGRDVVTGNTPRGLLEEIRIWNVARSTSEIQSNMTTGLTGSETGLVAYYDMDEMSGQVLTDKSPNAYHGVLGNSTAEDSADPEWTIDCCVSEPCPPIGGVDVICDSPIDVLFVLDNSGSIDPSEFNGMVTMTQNSITDIESKYSNAKYAVVHYGGHCGKEIFIEHDFTDEATVQNINRQLYNGDDLNLALGVIGDALTNTANPLIQSPTSTLSRRTGSNFIIVVYTDAGPGYGNAEGGSCINSGLTALKDISGGYTERNALEVNFDAKFTVVYFKGGGGEEACAAIASPGGTYTGTVDNNLGGRSPGTTPRQLIIADDFNASIDILNQLPPCDSTVLESCCSSLLTTTNTISTDPCCFSINLDNHVGSRIIKFEAEVITPDWQFASSYLQLNSSYNWVGSPTNKKVVLNSGGTIPGGQSLNVFDYCIVPTVDGASTEQEIVYRWYENNGSNDVLVCEETVVLNCAPILPDPCAEIIETSVTCDDDNPNEYFFKFKVKNNSSSTMDKLLLEDLTAGFGFTSAHQPFTLISLDPDPLLPGQTSNTICVKIKSSKPTLRAADVCFKIGLHGNNDCCYETDVVCITLPRCCQTQTDTDVSVSIGNSGNYFYSIRFFNPWPARFATHFKLTLSPGAIFTSSVAGPSAPVDLMPSEDNGIGNSIVWSSNSGPLPSGTLDDLILFNIDETNAVLGQPLEMQVDLYSSLVEHDYLAYSTTIPLDDILPIELLNFTAQPTKDQKSQLNWTTVTEYDNSHFNIQHSTNGKDWITLGKVQGAGNSTTAQHYDWLHEQPNIGQNFYRLEQFDFNGASTFSTIEIVEIKGEQTIITYQNPIKEELYLKINAPQEEESIFALYNNNGQLIEQRHINLHQGTQTLTLKMAHLPQGLYLLKVIGNTTEVLKIVKD